METSLIGKALNFGFKEYGFESHVSNIINLNQNISFLLNHININYLSKNLSFVIFYKNKFLNILNFFKKINLINNFSIFKKKKLVYLNIRLIYYKNFKFLKNFKFISKTLAKYYISLKALKLLNKRTATSIYLLSTNKGLLTHKEAIENHLSGYIIGFFYN